MDAVTQKITKMAAQTYAENMKNFGITEQIILTKNEKPFEKKTFDILKSDNNVSDSVNFDVNKNETDMSEVQQFYHGKNVLITGATGFLGKVLIEKLLRCCPGVENLYLVVRQKRGKDIYSRIDEIFEDALFDRLKEEVPKFRHKLVAIPGDCEAAGLGLTITDRQTITEKVNIVIHSAATVKFDEPLRGALATNVRAPLYLLQLARDMRSLDVFMHISTAFCNCHLQRIEERIYPCEADCDQLQEIIDKLTDEEVNDILPKLLGPWPNTYTFTKALAEKDLTKRAGNLPFAIFRPAIVTSTAKEPLKCWIDNMYGPTGVSVGSATGMLRTMHCNGALTAEVVPVDYVVNCLIVAAAKVHKAYKSSSPPPEPPIFNYVSSVENKITWSDFMVENLEMLDHYPLSNAVWYFCITMNKYAFMHKIYMLFLHLIPALIVDLLRLCIGRRPKMLKVYSKIHKFADVISYFCTKEIEFCNARTRQLWQDTSAKDKELFPFSMAELDWHEYFQHYLAGIRRYLFKDPDDTLPQAKIKWKRLYYLHQIVKTTFYVLVVYILFCVLSKLFKF